MKTLLMCFALLPIVFLTSQQSALPQETALAQETVEKPQTQHTETIDKLLNQYQDYGQLNGAVLVAEHGKVILRKGFGMANMEWDIPIEPNTKFRIGSVTKQFTATLILLLAEEGKIDLQSPMTKYLKDYRKDTGDQVTVHHLLRHTSGIPSYTTPSFFENESREAFEVEEFINKFASGELEFEPGSEFRYNNSGYYLLGAIIESVTGDSYASVLQERIFDPLGMTDTGYDMHAAIIKNRAQGYQKTPDGYINAAYLDMGSPFAAGSIYSTVDDLFKWDQALHGDKLLSTKSKELMVEPGHGQYGYGVVISEPTIGTKKLNLIQHGGGINGFNCDLARFVDQKHVIVILDNVAQGQYHRNMTMGIAAILEDQPFESPKKSIDELIAKITLEGGVDAAIEKYRELKESSSNEYNFSDQESLNGLGYRLMAEDKLPAALKVFKLNVEMFPEAFNPYDSLGEVYLMLGDEKLGLENYKKSVELNPENLGAVQAIRKLEGKELVVGPEILESYVGTYKAGAGFTLTMTIEGGKLIGEPDGQEPETLVPVSETEFLVAKINASVEFKKDESGKVTQILIKQGENSLTATKIE